MPVSGTNCNQMLRQFRERVLAVVGLYGLLSFSIARRTKEISVQMALGAQTGDVLRWVLQEGMLLAAVGVVRGLIVAAFATRVLTSYLYGISTLGTATFVSIPIVMFLAVLVACYIPARRATKVDPLIALRYESNHRLSVVCCSLA